MSVLLDQLETAIAQIAASHSVADPAALAAQVKTEVSTQVAGLQSTITSLQTALTGDEGTATALASRVTDLEKALTDTLTALNAGNVAAATTAASAAVNPPVATGAPAPTGEPTA